MKRILVVDDEQDICELLTMLLEVDGFQVNSASNGREAIKRIEETAAFDLIIADLKMPLLDGHALQDYLIENKQNVPIIFITAYGTVDDAVAAMKKGAADFITKPFNKNVIRHTVMRVLKTTSLKEENRLLKNDFLDFRFIYTSKKMRKILEMVEKVSRVKSPVLILGKSGTGKELIARAIHAANPEQPFVKINCPAVPETLMESELFGYRKGAFTGASSSFAGKARIADGGVLFFDEIGDLPLSVQPKLLRLLEDKQFEPLGSNTTIKIDTRVICATNRDLEALVRDGKFREDLYYRINTLTIRLPALSERKEDIIPLSEYFLKKYSLELGKKELSLSNEVRQAMEEYYWPGNIRELRNMIERAAVLSSSNTIRLPDMPLNLSEQKEDHGTPREQGEFLDDVQERMITETLRKHRGNVSAAARELGISRDTMRYRINKYGIEL